MTFQIRHILLLLISIICLFSGPISSADDTGQAAGQTARRAVLGINIDSGRGDPGPVEGVAVLGVAPGGAADDAGLRVDDVIVELNGVSLMAPSKRAANRKLLSFMSSVAPGDELRLVYLRDGQSGAATLTAGELDPDLVDEQDYPFVRDLERFGRNLGDDVIESLQFRWRHHGFFAGMQLVAVTPDLGRYFGADEGLLVVSAPKNESIDLKDGDVIIEIGGRKPLDPGHAMRILRSYEPGEEVIIGLMRNQRDQDVAIVLPETGQKPAQ